MRESGASRVPSDGLSTTDSTAARNRRWPPVAWRSGDGSAVGVLLGVVALGEGLLRVLGAGVSLEFGLVFCLLAVVGAVPVGVVRPGAAVAFGAGAGFLSLTLLDGLTVGAGAALLIALFRVGAVWAQALAGPFVVLALVRPSAVTVLLASLAPAAVWAGVAAVARKEALVHRAARQAVATTLVEHTARGERARIARELHDVVAHHISMIAVQAETARLTTPGLPALGAQRFSEIGDRARSGLMEMRRLLGVLKDDTDTADLRPQPGVAQLVELLDDARQIAHARLIVSGAPGPLDPGVELAAYRIVQEALTNARRHAPGAAVDVELRYGDELRVRIRDNGPGPTNPVGHGLTGMRERATAVGGTLWAGPTPLGGFLVEAALPVEAP